MTTHPTGDAPAASERVVEAVAIELAKMDFSAPWEALASHARDHYWAAAQKAIEAYGCYREPEAAYAGAHRSDARVQGEPSEVEGDEGRALKSQRSSGE